MTTRMLKQVRREIVLVSEDKLESVSRLLKILQPCVRFIDNFRYHIPDRKRLHMEGWSDKLKIGKLARRCWCVKFIERLALK